MSGDTDTSLEKAEPMDNQAQDEGDSETMNEVENIIKCCHLPHQTTYSLSRFLFVSLFLCSVFSVLWMITFQNIELNQYITQKEKTGMLIFVVIVTGFSTFSSLYGVFSLDRGWLMLSVIFQSALCTTCGIYVGTLLQIRTLGASSEDGWELTKYSGLVLLFGVLTSWFAFRAQEKMQEEHEVSKYVPGGFDLPDMTIPKFKLLIAVTSTMSVIIGVQLIVVGYLIEQPNGMARKMFRFHLMFWGSLFSFSGLLFLFFHLRGKGSNRAVLSLSTTLGFTLMTILHTVSGWMHFFREWYWVSCARWNNTMEELGIDEKKISNCTQELILGDAEVAVSYIAWIVICVHIWGCWRLSEKIQTEEMEEITCPSSLLKVLNNKKVYDLRLFVNILSYLIVALGAGLFMSWFMFQSDCHTETIEDDYLITYDAPVNCSEWVDESNEDSINAYSQMEMIFDYNYIPFILCLATGGCAFYGVVDEDRGWLIMAFLLFVELFGSSYPMMMIEQFEILNGNWLYSEIPSGKLRNLALISAYGKAAICFLSVLGIISTFMLSEAVQDMKEIRTTMCDLELGKVLPLKGENPVGNESEKANLICDSNMGEDLGSVTTNGKTNDNEVQIVRSSPTGNESKRISSIYLGL